MPDSPISSPRLSQEDRFLICDLGFYNNVMKGYIIHALELFGSEDSEITMALGLFDRALDELSAAEAEKVCRDFYKHIG